MAAGLWFGPLVDKTSDAVGEFLREHREGGETEFQEELERLLAKCRELAGHRNRVLHSAYLLLEGGDDLVAIVRSDMTCSSPTSLSRRRRARPSVSSLRLTSS